MSERRIVPRCEALSVVIPVYNSEASLPILIPELIGALSGRTFEIILVNDGSRDRSWEVIVELAARYPCVQGIRLMRNYGQHNALLCGIRAARYGITVTMDDDLQNPPHEVLRLASKVEEGWDVVYGTPVCERHGFLRDVASRITKIALQDAMGVETARNVSAFRAFRSNLRSAFADYAGPYVSIDVLLTWGTTCFTAIPVAHAPRMLGTSNYTIRALLAHAANMITGFSIIPLQVASMLGFTLTLFGTAAFILVIARFLLVGNVVPGFPFLASLICIFSGAQLFALGVIGEYLARIHFRTMQKPSYVMRADTGEQRSAAVLARSDEYNLHGGTVRR